MDNLMSIREAARFLGVSPTTLRRWHDNGSFLATFVSPGGHRYYSRADLEKQTKGLFRIAEEWVRSSEPSEPESEFYCSTSDRFKTRHERMTHEFEKRTDWQTFASLIASAAGEIGNNSFDHNLGNWPDLPGVFFAYDLGKRLVVLADRGVGVLATLQKVRPELITDGEALRVAFTEFVTGRAPEHRGNGLKFVRSALRQANADLLFQSGNAVLNLRRGKDAITIKTIETSIRGTLILITF